MTPQTRLNLARALDYVGDASAVDSLLTTLASALQSDLPEIQRHLDAHDLPAANRLLHQLKGFAPVFCSPPLAEEVQAVERLSKGPDLHAVQAAYHHLGNELQGLLREVQAHLSAGH